MCGKSEQLLKGWTLSRVLRLKKQRKLIVSETTPGEQLEQHLKHFVVPYVGLITHHFANTGFMVRFAGLIELLVNVTDLKPCNSCCKKQRPHNLQIIRNGRMIPHFMEVFQTYFCISVEICRVNDRRLERPLHDKSTFMGIKLKTGTPVQQWGKNKRHFDSPWESRGDSFPLSLSI